MKALVLERYNHLVYKEVEDPVTGPGEVLVKIKACGICGSDVHGMDGSTGRRIPPIIMGHEASGEIVRVAKNVTRWKPGDRVTFDSTVYKLDDWYTQEGYYNLSDNREVIGVATDDFRRQGAFAEYVSVPEYILYKIPDGVSYEEAALAEPAAVAMHAINRAKPLSGEIAVVVGAGMIGIFIIKLLANSGISKLIAIDISDKKRQQALGAGAEFCFDPAGRKLEPEIMRLSHNRGADLSFDAAGLTDSVKTSIQVLRRGGRAMLVGNLSLSVEFPLQKVVTRELTILSSCAIRGEYEAVLDLMAGGRLNVKDQISVVAPLSEGASWFEKLRNKDGGLNKVILVP